eukprot:403361291
MKQLQPMLDALKQVRPVTHRGQLSNVNLKKSMKIQLANRNLPVSRIQQKVVTQDIIHNDTKQNSNLSTIGGGMTSRENFTGLQSMSSVSRSSTPNTFHRRHKSSTHISAINQNILSGKLGTMQDPSEQIKYYQDYLREHQQSQKQLKQDLSSTLKLYEVDDIKILEDQYNQNTNKQKTELSDSHYTSDHQETLDKGIMTTRQPIEKQLNQSMNSRLKSQSRQKQVQSQKQPESSQINSKKRIDRYDFELKLQNIEKTYHQFEEFFNEYREEKQKEQIKEIFNPNEIGENFRENQSISYNYAQSMTNALVNSQKIHDMIESKIVGDQKIIFQDLKSTKCMCKNNNFMKRAQFRPENIGKNTNQEEQKQTFSQASSFHHRKRSLGRIQQQPSQNQNKFNSHHYNQGPIKLQLQATNQNRDLRILIEGHAPITINLNNLLLEQTQNCVAQPIDEYLNQKPAVDLNNMFMEEIQKQNRDIKIFEQLQSSFIKEPEAKLLQPNKNSEIQNLENQEYLKHLIDTDNKESNNHNTWKMHQNHLDRTKSKIKQQDLNSNQDAQQEQSQNILENEVMRSLFDIEILQTDQLKQIGKILPLHTLLNEKVFKFFAFIMQMTFQLYNESFQDFQKKCQNLQSELADLNYTRSDNDLLQMELVTLKQQLSEANDLLSIYNQDRQVVIKDIEKDILELNQNFNSHSRHQLKLKENIEKDVKLAINDISDQNKSQNENLLDMMNIILKKFEIVKYSLNQNSSIGTQTIIVGQQRIHTDQSQNKDSVQHGKSFYWKSLEVFRPLLSYELQRRRYFEVFEVQQICEEFISFITKIKLKNLENLHIPLQKLPYTITQETKQERLKNGNKRLNRPQSNIQLTYTLDKKVSPLMKDIIRYEKILKKEKYINTVFSQFLNDQTLALHSTDLLNKKLSLRIIFILFEIMLGKLQLQLKTELIDSIYHHYAQGDDYREASQISKYFSLIAVQVMMKNKSSTMHYDWLIEQLYGLITTQTQVSIQDLINDDFTNENVFNMVQKQFERTKDDSLHSTNVFNFQMHQIEEQKSPSENKSQSPSFIQSKSTFQRQPSYRRTAQAKTALIQLASSNSKKTSPIMPRGKESNYTLLDNSVSLSPSPNVLKSRFDKDQLDEENYDFTELNHITDQSIKNKLDARKEFIIKDLNMEKFIRLLNYQKIQLPCIKDALRDYKSFFIQDDEFKQEQIRIEKPANQIKTEQQYLSFLYIMKQGLDYWILQKYKQLDVNGKGLKEVELNQLLMQLDFHRQLKQKQFQHIIDEIKFAKIHQLMQLNQKAQSNSNTLSQNTQAVNSVQQQNVIGLNQTILITNQQPHTPSNLDQHNNHDKVEEFQRQLEDKKSDSFMMFKYKEIQDVIENKWWIIKELNSVRDDFLSIAQDIEKKKLLNKIRQKTLSNLKEKQKQTELSSLNNTAGKQHVKNGRSFDQSISDKQSHSITD